MAGIVVRTLEELKALQKNRAYPTIVIEGELANNLLISGMVSISDDGNLDTPVITRLDKPSKPGPMYVVSEILNNLSVYNEFKIVDGSNGKQIRIYPKPNLRRESN